MDSSCQAFQTVIIKITLKTFYGSQFKQINNFKKILGGNWENQTQCEYKLYQGIIAVLIVIVG